MSLINKLKLLKWRMELSFKKKRILSYENLNYKDTKAFLERDMLVLSHSLEKGMGIPNPRKGYGKEKALGLVNKLVEYSSKYEVDCFPFLESIAILDKYIELQKTQNENIDMIDKKRKEIARTDLISKNYCKAGSSIYTFEKLSSITSNDLECIFDSRHSIRHFSKETISEEEILKVVSLANKAPSACNRQPVKLYYTASQEKARGLEKIIDGSHGFKGETPYYMVITANRAYFFDDEFLQWYTNGGIYLAFLTLAFHSCGIGSIILQWKYAQKNEQVVKDFFGIKKSEAIIALIGYGKYPNDGTKCIVAQRKKAEDTLISIE